MPTRETKRIGVCCTALPANAYVVSSGKPAKVKILRAYLVAPVSKTGAIEWALRGAPLPFAGHC